jgi:hypothetical protein
MYGHRHIKYFPYTFLFVFLLLFFLSTNSFAQGVTTGSMSGLVTDDKGEPLVGANVVVVHDPSGTRYGAAVRDGGMFDIHNMKIGGPYTVTVSFVGYRSQEEKNVYISIGQTVRLDFKLVEEALSTEAIQVVAQTDEVMNAARTGAATYVRPEQVDQLPSIKRSTRDLTRLDPRSDGNFSFGGRNWLYNNISVDGSYFNNSFGLDDPAPGGQSNAEPIPFDAVEQVQVSVVPYDVREGGFTGERELIQLQRVVTTRSGGLCIVIIVMNLYSAIKSAGKKLSLIQSWILCNRDSEQVDQLLKTSYFSLLMGRSNEEKILVRTMLPAVVEQQDLVYHGLLPKIWT